MSIQNDIVHSFDMDTLKDNNTICFLHILHLPLPWLLYWYTTVAGRQAIVGHRSHDRMPIIVVPLQCEPLYELSLTKMMCVWVCEFVYIYCTIPQHLPLFPALYHCIYIDMYAFCLINSSYKGNFQDKSTIILIGES